MKLIELFMRAKPCQPRGAYSWHMATYYRNYMSPQWLMVIENNNPVAFDWVSACSLNNPKGK